MKTAGWVIGLFALIAMLAVGASWWMKKSNENSNDKPEIAAPVAAAPASSAPATAAPATPAKPAKAPSDFSESLSGALPDERVKQDLMEKGYPPVFIDELLTLRKMMRENGIKAEDIRNATLGGPKAREKFAKSLPQPVQRQVLRTIRMMINPPGPGGKSPPPFLKNLKIIQPGSDPTSATSPTPSAPSGQ